MNYIKKNVVKGNKKEVAINIIGMVVLLALFLTGRAVGRQRASHQPEIADGILRFHVIANSDSEEDQDLKLKIKEAILEMLRPKLSAAQTSEEAEEIISDNMEEIEKTADNIIKEEGYSYQSKGVLGKTTFPVKQYGDMVFPAGEYEAFRILLGEAEGKNWWCVMFPTLCYVDETYDVITEENKEQFKEILTEEEYASILVEDDGQEGAKEEPQEAAKGNAPEEIKVFYKLKTVVWLNKVIDYFSK